MLNKIENIKDTVQKLLTNIPETRANDRLLILKVWAEQDPQLRDESKYSFKRWGALFASGEFIDPESIRRTRQKLQEQYPHLRGANYKARKEHAGVMRQAMR